MELMINTEIIDLSAKTTALDGGYSAWPWLNRKATFYLNGVAIAMPFKCCHPPIIAVLAIIIYKPFESEANSH